MAKSNSLKTHPWKAKVTSALREFAAAVAHERHIAFGIQQKQIIVTCSYAARQAGIKKLQLVTEALKVCPTLIIRNGEDLDRYRAASRGIFNTVREWVGPTAPVERLGMDELFIDVTDLILQHLKERPASPDAAGQYTFARPASLSSGETDGYLFPASFQYHADRFAGHTLPVQIETANDPYLERLRIGANLADFLRQLIRHRLGFTCSAGIASNKLVAKLAADVHKPNLQTTITLPHDVFVAPFPVRKLNGFGFKVLEAVLAVVEPTAPLVDGPGRYYEDQKPVQKEKAQLLGAQTKEVLVRDVRDTLDEAWFTERFGAQRGGYLWGLLWGVDESAVTATPTIPQQITIEDSFIHCHTREDITRYLLPLAEGLLLRLERELVVHGQWQRYPLTLRLTVRLRSDGPGRDQRESKSVRMPVYIFDLSRSRADRVAALMQGPLLRLTKALIPQDDFACTLFNIGACHLRRERPSASIDTFLQQQNIPPKREDCVVKPPQLPDDVWLALDAMTQRELSMEWQDEAMAKAMQPSHEMHSTLLKPTHSADETTELEEWMDTDDYT